MFFNTSVRPCVATFIVQLCGTAFIFLSECFLNDGDRSVIDVQHRSHISKYIFSSLLTNRSITSKQILESQLLIGTHVWRAEILFNALLQRKCRCFGNETTF
jgi:hypothetical protein